MDPPQRLFFGQKTASKTVHTALLWRDVQLLAAQATDTEQKFNPPWDRGAWYMNLYCGAGFNCLVTKTEIDPVMCK